MCVLKDIYNYCWGDFSCTSSVGLFNKNFAAYNLRQYILQLHKWPCLFPSPKAGADT